MAFLRSNALVKTKRGIHFLFFSAVRGLLSTGFAACPPTHTNQVTKRRRSTAM
jgi:hypothetical protein